MKKTFLTLISALYATTALSAIPTCEEMPRCEDLGYNDSASTCENSIGCPFDPTKVACIVRKYDPNKDCAIGDVYYANGTCGSIDDYDGSKTPIGVVFMLTDKVGNVVNTTTSNHGKIVSLNDAGWALWSHATEGKILETQRIMDLETLLADADGKESQSIYFSGKADTKAIIEALPNETTAAKVAYDYYPVDSLKDDPFAGQGQWYLPSAGESVYFISTPRPTFSRITAVNATYTTLDTLNDVLEKLGGSKLENEFSVSTENTDTWRSVPSLKNTVYTSGKPYWGSYYKTARYFVRPILAF